MSWGLAVAVWLFQILVLNPDDRLGYPPVDEAWRWTACHVSVTVTAGLLLIPATLGHDRRGLPQRLLALPVLRWLGMCAYGFYLWHLPVLFWVADRGWNTLGPVPMIPYATIALAITVTLAWLSYRFVEEPFHTLKSKPR